MYIWSLLWYISPYVSNFYIEFLLLTLILVLAKWTKCLQCNKLPAPVGTLSFPSPQLSHSTVQLQTRTPLAYSDLKYVHTEKIHLFLCFGPISTPYRHFSHLIPELLKNTLQSGYIWKHQHCIFFCLSKTGKTSYSKWWKYESSSSDKRTTFSCS